MKDPPSALYRGLVTAIDLALSPRIILDSMSDKLLTWQIDSADIERQIRGL
jgi:hypothetical protein